MWYLISNAISGNLEEVLGAGLPESAVSLVWAICSWEVVLALCVALALVSSLLVGLKLFCGPDGLTARWLFLACVLGTGVLALLLLVSEDAVITTIDENRIEEPPATWVALAERFEELPELPPEGAATYVVTDREEGAIYVAVVEEGGAGVQLTYLESADEADKHDEGSRE